MAGVQTSINIPAELKARVESIAEQEDRSTNAQIINFVRQGIAEYEKRQQQAQEQGA